MGNHGHTFKNLIGQAFGKLTVIREAGGGGKGNRILWLCRCECGTIKSVNSSCLIRGATKSCGCLRREFSSIRNSTHGMSKTAEYRIWSGMLDRCCNPNSKDANRYSKRGIVVCSRWYEFENFLADMGYRPNSNYTIERIDNDGSYSPKNCVWATAKKQARNRRNNHILLFKGQLKTIAEWSEIVGISYYVIHSRINSLNWDVERALITPPRKLSFKF